MTKKNKNLERIEKKAILVGGYVRDFILKLTSNDLDYVVEGETVESMLEAGFKLVGADFPVFLHPVTGDEYALARIERKNGVGYTGFSCETKDVSLKDDFGRRDLTVNSMGMDSDDNIIDFYNGIADIKNKILRHTTLAFAEDPLRVLRLARFTAKLVEFTIAEETKVLARSLKDELKYLTPERVFKELEKALKSERPSNYFRALLDLDALEIVHPEIFAMISCEQRTDYHAEGDVFEHTMRVLDEVSKLSKDPIVRYCALYHDIGKPVVDNKTGSFYDHEDYDVIKPLFDVLKEKKHPNSYVNMGMMVSEWHGFTHKFKSMKPGTLVKKMTGDSPAGSSKKKIKKTFPRKIEEFECLINVSKADNVGRILGTRKLSFDETELIFSGGSIEGFSRRGMKDHEVLRTIFTKLIEKVVLPKEVINGPVSGIKDFIFKEKVARVRSIKYK